MANVLIACEESQRVCTAFRNRGHRAFSCDILPCSGGHPEWHIQGDVLPLINGNCEFETMDGTTHRIDGRWDLLIAHPPCTFLTVTGNRWFDVARYGDKAIQRLRDRTQAVAFFIAFAAADCRKIAIENPIGVMSTLWRKPDQIIHPYMFGEPERKATCLWMRGLPLLQPTNVVEPEIVRYKNGKGTDSRWHVDTMGLPADERRRLRSVTFFGIAEAMAEQWGGINDGD